MSKTVLEYTVKVELDPYTLNVLNMLSVEEIKANIAHKLEQQLIKIRDGLINTNQFNIPTECVEDKGLSFKLGGIKRDFEVKQDTTLLMPFTFTVD